MGGSYDLKITHPITQEGITRMDHYGTYSKICELREEADRLEREDLVRRIAASRKSAYDGWRAGYPDCALDTELAARVTKLETRVEELEQTINARRSRVPA